jgi:hypothetical protein
MIIGRADGIRLLDDELPTFIEPMALVSRRSFAGPQTASFVDKIVKDERPADLSVEQPKRFELIVNLKTAKALWDYDRADAAGASR